VLAANLILKMKAIKAGEDPNSTAARDDEVVMSVGYISVALQQEV
jgi:hypothetical protein